MKTVASLSKKRHTPYDMSAPTDSTTPIKALDQLRCHLQTAIEIEHATIPPYFTAWLSANERANPEVAQIIRSVMLEEMLHLTLAANLLNAVGGHPSLTHGSFVPRYPHRLPHSGRRFLVSIEKFSPEVLDIFLKIERPELDDAEPESDEYRTIGQFYDAIAQGFERLCDEFGEEAVFIGLEDNQVQPEDYYGSGNIVVVRDLASARQAIEEIKEQGEGANKTVFDEDRVILGSGLGFEPGHYFRFLELKFQRRYLPGDTQRTGPTGSVIPVHFEAVFSISANQKISDYQEGSAIRAALEAFYDSYQKLLANLEAAFSGKRDQLNEAVARMFELKNQALALMRTPTSQGSGTTVGLAFTKD